MTQYERIFQFPKNYIKAEPVNMKKMMNRFYYLKKLYH